MQSNNEDPFRYESIEKHKIGTTLGLDLKSNFSITPRMISGQKGMEFFETENQSSYNNNDGRYL